MKPVFINFVLDKSTSMTPLRQSSIEGFNQFLTEQRGQPGELKMSLTLFDTAFDVRYVGEDIYRVPQLTQATYVPSGCTALLDAVGTTIKGAEQWIENHRYMHQPCFQGPARDWNVIVAVLTDGEENSSREWHINQPMVPGDERDLNGLIQWKQNEGWTFVFLGAGGSDWLERTFGKIVPQEYLIGYAHDTHSHRHTYAGLSSAVSTSRNTGNFTFEPTASPHNHTINQNTYDDGHSVSSSSKSSS